MSGFKFFKKTYLIEKFKAPQGFLWGFIDI